MIWLNSILTTLLPLSHRNYYFTVYSEKEVIMDPTTLRTYIEQYRSQRDTARQYKDSYNNSADQYDRQASTYKQQADQYRSQAKQYEEEENGAQRNLDYYKSLASQTEQEAKAARQEA